MYDWQFTMKCPEVGTASFKVRAKDKKSAIDKGFAKIKRMGLTVTPHWNCHLIRNF